MALVDCAEFRLPTTSRRGIIRTLIPSTEEDLDARAFVLTPTSFRKSELLKLVVHKTATELHYDFGIDTPDNIPHAAVQQLIQGLLPSGSERGRSFVHDMSSINILVAGVV